MADRTTIEWTATRHADGTVTPGATWNPVRGCTRVSEGCRNCYAERVAARFSGPGQPYEGLATMTPSGPRWTGEVRLVEEHLADPLRWKRPRKIFVNSTSDLFHERIPEWWLDRTFAVMALAPWHTFQVLTKRPERMARYFSDQQSIPPRHRVHSAANHQAAEGGMGPGSLWGRWHAFAAGMPWPLPNVWLGVSCEDQATADQRIPLLLQCPAAVRFVSAEPLLGAINLSSHLQSPGDWQCPRCRFRLHKRLLRASDMAVGIDRRQVREVCPNDGAALVPATDLHWLIAGGESGSGARPMHPDWARGLRDDCQAARVAFFFKQFGAWLHEAQARTPEQCEAIGAIDARRTMRTFSQRGRSALAHRWPDGSESFNLGKHAAGRLLDGRTWDEMPEVAP